MANKTIGFRISTSARDDGTIEAVYILFSTNRVVKTREIIEDALIADYDYKGELVGVEILAPVRIGDITGLVQRPKRQSLQKFIKQAAPQKLVLAGR